MYAVFILEIFIWGIYFFWILCTELVECRRWSSMLSHLHDEVINEVTCLMFENYKLYCHIKRYVPPKIIYLNRQTETEFHEQRWWGNVTFNTARFLENYFPFLEFSLITADVTRPWWRRLVLYEIILQSLHEFNCLPYAPILYLSHINKNIPVTSLF